MLQVCEIFKSLQGETSRAGRPCVFVRLSGCDLECAWCDTTYARREPGTPRSVTKLVETVQELGGGLVALTGGEPLLQAETPELAVRLAATGWEVLVETNGAQDISVLPPPVVRIVDFKAPASGMTDRMDWNNPARLRPTDEVKLVLVDRADYEWARALLPRLPVLLNPPLFSPVTSRLTPRQLAEWILQDGLNVRLQLQLHRLIWPDQDRGV